MKSQWGWTRNKKKRKRKLRTKRNTHIHRASKTHYVCVLTYMCVCVCKGMYGWVNRAKHSVKRTKFGQFTMDCARFQRRVYKRQWMKSITTQVVSVFKNRTQVSRTKHKPTKKPNVLIVISTTNGSMNLQPTITNLPLEAVLHCFIIVMLCVFFGGVDKEIHYRLQLSLVCQARSFRRGMMFDTGWNMFVW